MLGKHMNRAPRIFATLIIGAIATLAVANNLLLSQGSLDTLRQAVNDAEKGNKQKAVAVMKGLLMSTVTVGIDRSTLPSDRRASSDFEYGVQTGIDTWNSAMEDSPFVAQRQNEKPDVIVKFVDSIETGDHAQGMIRAQRNIFWSGKTSSSRLSGTIYVRINVGRRRLTEDEVGRIVTHELGHLLGLDDDHDGRGVMGDFGPGRGNPLPSRSELNAVRAFRDSIKTALRNAGVTSNNTP